MAPYNGVCLAELLADQKSERTEMFFVGRRGRLPGRPILHCVRGLLKLEHRVLWDSKKLGFTGGRQ